MEYDDNITPTMELVLEVLGARKRLGEEVFTFSRRQASALYRLSDLGYVDVFHGTVENTLRASLTELGEGLVLDPRYVPPIMRGAGGQLKVPDGSVKALEGNISELEVIIESLRSIRDQQDGAGESRL